MPDLSVRSLDAFCGDIAKVGVQGFIVVLDAGDKRGDGGILHKSDCLSFVLVHREPPLNDLLHHKRKEACCRVKLCGRCEQDSGGPPDLHELHRIKRKTVMYEGGDLRNPDLFGEESLEPEAPEPADNGFYIIFINGGISLTNSISVRLFLIIAYDRVLIGKRDAVIRDDRGKQECMGSSAYGTANPANPESNRSVWQEDVSFIVSMDGQASGMAAGTTQLVELEGIND